MKTVYGERTIHPAPAGFGEWQVGEAPSEWWSDLSDLEGAIRDAHPGADLYRLDRDINEDGSTTDGDGYPIKDIRGLIHDEPSYVYALVEYGDEGGVTYFGVEEREAAQELARDTDPAG